MSNLANEVAPSSARAAEPAESATPLHSVVMGAAIGTVIEYYDFGIYSALAIYLATHFFPPDNPSLGQMLAVASTGIAFLVRPLGGMFFGALSDRIGRKFTFMVTLFLMSGATIAMGLVPGYVVLGIAAPIIIVGLRVLQGLAIGGEYAAAATYVVEHAPDRNRGYYTAWLGSMTSGSLLVSLLAVAGTRVWLGRERFDAWGWRLPFIYAAGLLVVAVFLRMRLRESPIFVHLKKKMGTAKTPLRDVLTQREHLLPILAVGFGMCAPQITAGVSGSLLALYFLQTTTQIDPGAASFLIASGCLVGVPLTVYFGWLSDRWGRKPVQLLGMLTGIVIFLPLYYALVTAVRDESAMAYVYVGLLQIPGCMMVGPGFAAMTESFRAAHRSTSTALAFSIGGVIGGFSPAVALSLSNMGGSIYWGVAYPVAVFLLGAFVNYRFVRENSYRNVWDDV